MASVSHPRMIGLCLSSGVFLATLQVQAFTLAWVHSIDKSRWEEDWRVEPQALILSEARIRGIGAGMEPPPGSTLRNGVWHYVPERTEHPQFQAVHTHYTGGYELCFNGQCQPLAQFFPEIDQGPDTFAVIEFAPCPES